MFKTVNINLFSCAVRLHTHFLCTAYTVPHCSPYEVDSDVQFVCKYLNAYDLKDNQKKGINRLYESPEGGLIRVYITTGVDRKVSDDIE